MQRKNKSKGFSLIELAIAMTVTLVLLGLISTLFARASSTRNRESRRTDALVSAQAALNVISREISNSGYGIIGLNYGGTKYNAVSNNGLILADCNSQRIHFRADIDNDTSTGDLGEDVTYFFDSTTRSILRYDPNAAQKTSIVVNKISSITLTYYDYTGNSSTPSAAKTVPTLDTSRVTINITVDLDPVEGQPSNQKVKLASDVTLRNSKFMLKQY